MQEQKVNTMFVVLGGLCGVGLALVGILIGNAVARATAGAHGGEHAGHERPAEH